MSFHPNKPTSYEPVDWSRYAWKVSADPLYYSRYACGGEAFMDFMHRFKFGQHYICRGVYLTISNPLSAEEFLVKIRNVWEVLRFYQPNIALQSDHDENEEMIMRYRVVDSPETLRDWSGRTVRFCEGETDLEELRFQKGQNRLPEENGDQTFLYVIARSPTSYGLLFNSHHAPFDGVGLKIMFTRFCKIFASGIKSESLDWGKETPNLSPGFASILNENEALSGPAYDNYLHTVVDDYFSAMQRRVGINDRELCPGPTRRHHVLFSIEETSRLLKRCKTLGYTLNIVAHAALCIMTEQKNPRNKSMPPDASYAFYGLVNARERLIPPYNGRDVFTGWGLGITVLQIPLSVIAFSAAAGEVGQLKTVSEAVKAEYMKQKGSHSLLAAEPRMTEAILKDVTPGVRPAPWTTPSFSGDGIGETYMDRDYKDPEGNLSVSIEDYFSSVNVLDSGCFFRIWTWRDQMQLSVDYNTAVVSTEEVKELMDDWITVIRRVYA